MKLLLSLAILCLFCLPLPAQEQEQEGVCPNPIEQVVETFAERRQLLRTYSGHDLELILETIENAHSKALLPSEAYEADLILFAYWPEYKDVVVGLGAEGCLTYIFPTSYPIDAIDALIKSALGQGV